MTVVGNVTKQDVNKPNMTSVNIEECDESWALNLLKEYEKDEGDITVHTQEYGDLKAHEDLTSTISKQLEHAALLQDTTNRLQFDEHEDLGANILSLSAIENQKLEFAQKQEDIALAEASRNRKASFSFSRVLRVFTK